MTLTSREALDIQLGMIENALSIMRTKRRDYSGDEDPLANFRNSEKVGVPPSKGAFIRLLDKISRIANSLDRPLDGEDVYTNDYIDVINYICLVAMLKMEEDDNLAAMEHFFNRSDSIIDTIEDLIK